MLGREVYSCDSDNNGNNIQRVIRRLYRGVGVGILVVPGFETGRLMFVPGKTTERASTLRIIQQLRP